MSGNKVGGAKCAVTNKLKYGNDFYSRIGAIGGRNGHTGGFYADRELARRAGRKGGQVSRRPKHVTLPEEGAQVSADTKYES